MNAMREGEPSFAETAESSVRKIVTGIVIAGAAIALALYSRPAPPRYQVIAAGAGIVRIDTTSGTVIACEAGRCMTVLRRGQHLEPRSSGKALPSAPAAAPALLPPPAAEPAAGQPAERTPAPAATVPPSGE